MIFVAIESKSPAIVKGTEWMKQILKAKHEKANMKDVVVALQTSINQFQSLFDGTLGH
jgi:hypothetical protein